MKKGKWQKAARKFVGSFLFLLFTSLSHSQETQPLETMPAQSPSAPQIIIHSPTPNQKINALKLLVKGEVIDDGEVVSIIIGDVSLGVSGSKIPFQYPVYLKSGKNDIRIEAMDSQGNKSLKTITVFSDAKGTEGNKTKVSAPVVVLKTSKKNETTIPAIPDLPSKPIIVKKEDYVKITSTPTAVDEAGMLLAEENLVTAKTTESKQKKMVVAKASKKVFYAHANKSAKKKKIRHTSTHSWSARRLGKFVTITPRILVNDRSVHAAVEPVVQQGRTYVALEDDFTSKLGVQVVHDKRGGKQYVYFIAKGKTVKLSVGGGVLYSNGNAVKLASPLRTKQGKLMVPFRVVCEELGFYVSWDTETRTASAHQH